ncbi:MAG TPA: Na(+)-translocating NADH-quinone reductase subunit C [Woeseiaceae bacterium]|nr:Na(+)-translocating NADH-quinone reductase subunit C [Woeseiaceae bacterium]
MPDTTISRTSRNRDGIANTLIVAVGVSLFCSVLVSAAAVILKPEQQRNEELYRQRIVLDVAGIYEAGGDIEAQFSAIDTRLVELQTGTYVSGIDPQSFDALEARNDPDVSIRVPPELDIAGIRRRSIYSPVYLVRDGDTLTQIVLPVYGSGLWSRMHGFLSLEPDGNTIRGLQFYEHGETPGLGDQIDKPDWRAQWSGKLLTDETGQLRIEVVRGKVIAGEGDEHQVDGLAGATLTGRGVTHLLQYWMGPHGFGPYLQKIAEGNANNG